MDLNLENKVVLVTGGGRGLGAACVEGFVNEGAEVIAVARSESEVNDLAERLDNVTPWVMDVTQPDFIQRLSDLDRLDILINNAGFNDPKPMADTSEETLDTMLNLNVRAVYLACKAALSVMVRQNNGAIVNMSSQMGHVGAPSRTVYCMTKHAVEGLTKALAVEVASQGIRVNSVAPTFIETELTRPMLAKPEFAEYVYGNIPMARLGQIEDVVNAVLYLASDVSATTTGHSLLVDGGWTAH